jgi:hypothetical protein
MLIADSRSKALFCIFLTERFREISSQIKVIFPKLKIRKGVFMDYLKNPIAALEAEGVLFEYPYWRILEALNISKDKKFDLESILWMLSERLSGVNYVFIQDDELTDELLDEIATGESDSKDRIISASTAGRFPEGLLKNLPPTWEESLFFISSVLEISDEETVKDILRAMRGQGMFTGLINFLLDDK